MNNTSALRIRQEILPLFDRTENSFSKEELVQVLSEPLKSKEEILSRQEILRGFIANHDILKDYSYSQLDFFEVYNFLASLHTKAIPKLTLMIDLQFSKERRDWARSKFIQSVLLLNRLNHFYFKRIDARVFPESYRQELQKIAQFLEDLNLINNERLIRENKVRVSHIVNFMDLLTQKVTNDEHSNFWKRLFIFEAYLSISKAIVMYGYSFPIFTENDFSFKSLYHPLLKQAVKNDITLCNNVIIFTGPNMSGKSTFLKALGLSVYLGHLGLAVPAGAAAMPYFDSISIAINLNDDIMQGYSHFMTELKNLKQVVTDASDNRKCFAIFDELFRGTNIEDALHISSSTIIGLTQFNQSYFLISTHLSQLKDMALSQENKIAAFYFDCDLQNGSPSFNYQLKKGWSELKIGKILFDKEGLPDLLNPVK
ncbi:hypothetical protein QTN47_05285 [Danxiaibacter flavus]|uniref:DNA mismatch repair proteins mutS family domain-containing protein n=1 Tax=Danxiaibacter flavus TaxID=3049108 RepID=A0ABV3ZBM3_9BACT|nr:hypothetical protein QNM32_05285 [Chitinophagaceae bacterium DXS]